MCGIAGILLRRGRPDEAVVRRMAAALAHRGPDDLGVHLTGRFGLAQTRLSIIDLAGGHQPMVDGDLALAVNGEIYNFVELRRNLEARGRRFATASDSETILHLYALHGPDGVASLNGMFAFALYDGRRAIRGSAALRLRAQGAPGRLARRPRDRPGAPRAVAAESVQQR
jgi:asparagine synthase (glutamine-hydrolysing)